MEDDGWVAHYVETEIYVGSHDGTLLYHMARQPVDTRIGDVRDWKRLVERFDCRRPRDGYLGL
jgi:hypothetical protein